eukprot:jgi/Mesvir1/198/Mv13547-RA.1
MCLDVMAVDEFCLAMPCDHVNGHAECCRLLIQTRVMADGVTSQTFMRCELGVHAAMRSAGGEAATVRPHDPPGDPWAHPGSRGTPLAGAIVITYHVPSSVQDADGDAPGKPFKGLSRQAYLPNSPQGGRLLQMLQRAFEQSLAHLCGGDERHDGGRERG